MAVGSFNSLIKIHSEAGGNLEERRRFERFSVELPVELQVIHEGQSRERHAVATSDVSQAGAYVRTKMSIQKGARLQVKLILLNERVKELTGAQGCLTIGGTVARADSTGIGISFDENFLHDVL